MAIGAGASLRDCVVADGVHVPAGAQPDARSLVMRDDRLVGATVVGDVCSSAVDAAR